MPVVWQHRPNEPIAMPETFDPNKAARYIAQAHESRATFCNLPRDIAPRTVAEAYAAQAALAQLLAEREGPVAGLKIATTTKVMQQLMGIDHPCGGLIFERRVFRSPTQVAISAHMHLVLECELAVRIGRPLAGTAEPYSRETVTSGIAAVMPAFELIEDRNADYKSAQALSMIADNCWNAGVVLGRETVFDPSHSLDRVHGSVEIDGRVSGEGMTDDPLGALAWVANLAVEHGRSLQPGMVVITGSIIPTFPVQRGNRVVFSVDDLGSTELVAN
jgi:2-keto-4-pentenoate hydratase